MQQTLYLPYMRPSPVYIPRRDLVLGAADSVLLTVTVVESDDPSAQALVVTGGLGGPALRMTVCPDSTAWFHEYGMWHPIATDVLWSGLGTINDTLLGTFDLRIPIATMAGWPLRCIYALQLDWDAATRSETLASGRLHISRASFGGAAFDGGGLLTSDSSIQILTDSGQPVEV